MHVLEAVAEDAMVCISTVEVNIRLGFEGHDDGSSAWTCSSKRRLMPSDRLQAEDDEEFPRPDEQGSSALSVFFRLGFSGQDAGSSPGSCASGRFRRRGGGTGIDGIGTVQVKDLEGGRSADGKEKRLLTVEVACTVGPGTFGR